MPPEIQLQIEQLIAAKNAAVLLELVKSGAVKPNDTLEIAGYRLQLLRVALDRQWDELAVYLINHGAEVQGGRGRPQPILMACENGNHDVIEALIAAGANVNVKAARQDGETDYTPLMVAAEDSDLWCVRRLLAAGADPAAQDYRRETAIHYALKRYFVGPQPKADATQVVQALLAAGCPLSGTELHYAIHCRDVGMTRLLLERGSPIDVPLAARNSLEKDGPRKGDTPLKVLQRPNAVDLSGGVLDFEPTEARREAITELLRSAGAERHHRAQGQSVE